MCRCGRETPLSRSARRGVGMPLGVSHRFAASHRRRLLGVANGSARHRPVAALTAFGSTTVWIGPARNRPVFFSIISRVDLKSACHSTASARRIR
jgi:hypothetical protein